MTVAPQTLPESRSTVDISRLSTAPSAVAQMSNEANGWYQIWTQAAASPTASLVFRAALFAVGFVALDAVHQTASRII